MNIIEAKLFRNNFQIRDQIFELEKFRMKDLHNWYYFNGYAFATLH